MKNLPVLEWRLQAAAVRRLRARPDFDRTFTLAGDFNSAPRSAQAATKAAATGLTPGETDLRIYVRGGRLGLVEMKGARGRLSPEQTTRHELLRALGFDVRVVKAKTEEEAGDMVESLVEEWLALPANDNHLRAGSVAA